ncbi:related to F-box/WD-repeat protein [Cephalotrichum gorgonifer]|uniref:Related to F-box/WD-repeat protein n=1 Tax=Cephalotrichum gorgonifer TaxID=2041049 RepID=A0AAE8MW11_9PEZI|nr:related to F-box/WD-repeat protein [Cephalotrichum gorgonifer]
MAPKSTSKPMGGGVELPLTYRIFFLLVEPVLALVGAFYAHFRPLEYLTLTHATSAPNSVEAIPLGTTIALSQLANLYLFFAINEAFVLRSTPDLRVWKTVLFCLLETMLPEPSASPIVPVGPGPGDSLNAPDGNANGSRARSISLSNLLRRRPKSLIINPNDNLAMSSLARALPEMRTESAHGWNGLPEKSEGGSGLRRVLRRASTSLRVKLHRRPGLANSSLSEEPSAEPRPTTAYATWNRLRQATSFRQSRTSYGAGPADFPPYDDPALIEDNLVPLPVPSIGGEPPIIPHHTGAAAKASVAMQNEYLLMTTPGVSAQQPAAHGFQNKRLTHLPGDECGNDRESGIGINVAGSVSEADFSESKRESLQGPHADISRLDFITKLPTELAIQVLSHLDCAGLVGAGRVSRAWRTAVLNQHIWRESFLREKTATYATSEPIRPGAGFGVPTIKPSNDWREIYLAREELDRRWRRGEAKPVYLNGHMDSIYCLQFDEFKIITGSRDKTIRVWDMHTFECKLVIGPPEVMNDAFVLVDENKQPVHYATLSNNQRVAYSMPTLVSFPTHHKASILCLQYDDELLVTGSSDATCIVYNVKSGYRPVRRLRHHTAAVLDLVFDDKHIVTCSKDVSICVWDRKNGTLLRQLKGHSGPVNAVQMRGNTIVSCSGDFRVKLWNIDTGKNIREFAGHTKGLACSQFSEDGRYIASAGNDKVIRIWDANTGECLREMKAHEGLVRTLHIDSVSGRLVSGSYDTDIKVFDMETGCQLLDFPKWHASWVLSAKSDYRRIVSTGQDPKILILDFGAGVHGIQALESVERRGGAEGAAVYI